jgi:hypothetical protein
MMRIAKTAKIAKIEMKSTLEGNVSGEAGLRAERLLQAPNHALLNTTGWRFGAQRQKKSPDSCECRPGNLWREQ